MNTNHKWNIYKYSRMWTLADNVKARMSTIADFVLNLINLLLIDRVVWLDRLTGQLFKIGVSVVAIHNFLPEETQWKIKLTVGESVHILEENADWYFGFVAKNRGLQGIFPKLYIKVMESYVDRSGWVPQLRWD